MADIAELGVKVTTEGASESAKQLDALASSAEQAQRKTEELGKSQGKTSENLSSARNAASMFGEALTKVASDSTALGAALGGAAGAGLAEIVGNLTTGIIRWVGAMVTAGDQLKELSDKTDLSARDLQKWSYIGDQVGVNSRALVSSVQMLHQRLGDLSDGTGVAGQALKRLGIDQQALNAVGGDTNAMLDLLHSRMQGIIDPSERANVLFQLFGRSARDLAPLFKASSEDIARLSTEFDALGIAMSDRLVNASDQLTDSTNALFGALRGMLYPALEAIIDPLSKFVDWIKDAVAQSGAMREAAFLLEHAVNLLSVPFRALGVVLIGVATSFEIALITLRAGATTLIALANNDIPAAKDALATAGDQIVEVSRRNRAAMADMLGVQDEVAESARRVSTEQQELSRAYALVGKTAQSATGVTATFHLELQALQLVAKDAGWSQKQYTEAVEELISKQPSAVRLVREWKEQLRDAERAKRDGAAALRDYLREQEKLARYADQQVARAIKLAEAEAKAIRIIEDARAKEIAAMEAGTAAITKKAEATQFDIDKVEGRIAKYETFETVQLRAEAANYRETASIIAMFDPTSELIKAYEERAAAIDALISKQQQLGEATESAQAARDAASQWTSAANQIEQALTDALVNGFNSGKSIAKSVGEWIVNYFKATISRGIAQAFTGIIASGVSTIASAAGGGGSVLGGISSIGGTGGLINSAMGAIGLGGGISGLGAGFGSGVLGAFGGAFGEGASLLGAGFGAEGIGMMAGAAAPYIAAAYGLYRIISGVGTGRTRGPAWQQWGAQTAGGTPWDAYSGVTPNPALGGAGYFNPQLNSIINAVSSAASAFGGRANPNTAYGLYVAQGTEGSGALADARVRSASGAALFGYSNNGANEDVYQRLMSTVPGMILAGLQDSELPAQIKAYFNSVSANGVSQEQLDLMLQTASAAQTMADSFKQLGGPFAQLQNLSVEARIALANMAGGIEDFTAKVSGYYSAFYSNEEQQAMALLSAQRTLEAAGIDTSNLRDRAGFRSAVEGLDLSTEDGQKKFAAYMNAAGAFASGSDLLAATGQTLAQLTADAPDYTVPLVTLNQQTDITNTLLASIVDAVRNQQLGVNVVVNVPATVEVGQWGGTTGGGN
jgi:hypothetical protein